MTSRAIRTWLQAVALVTGATVVATGTRALAGETVAIRGRVVVSPSQRPLARALVVVRDAGGRELHLTTDHDGRYVAIGLSAGPIDVSVEHEGFNPESQSCGIADGDTLRLDFDLVDHLSNTGRRSFPCRIEPQTADRYVIE